MESIRKPETFPMSRPSFDSNGIISALVKQFGAGILVAVVCAYSTIRVYNDLERRTDALLSVHLEALRDTAAAINRVSSRLDENSESVRSLKHTLENKP